MPSLSACLVRVVITRWRTKETDRGRNTHEGGRERKEATLPHSGSATPDLPFLPFSLCGARQNHRTVKLRGNREEYVNKLSSLIAILLLLSFV